MAKTLKSFDFGTRANGGGKGKYDWVTWLNGKIYQLTEQEDYTCSTKTLVTDLRIRSKKMGGAVRTSYDKDTKTVTFQFYKVEEQAVEAAPKKPRKKEIDAEVGF